ncbi:MAG TPA: hypothetical protein VF892_23160 [Pseudonocardiaceae bacterium]
MSRIPAAAALYRQLGWSPGRAGELVWLRTGNTVDALALPRPLGERTLRLLAAESPLFEVTDPAQPRWVFLSRPARRPVQALAELGVEHITGGRTVDLPPSRFGETRLVWLVAPTTPLPPFMTVVDAIIQSAA